MIGKQVSVKIHGLEIIGKLLSFNKNAIIQDVEGSRHIIRESGIQHIALLRCPYYIQHHNPCNDFCTLMLDVCENSTQKAQNFETCFTFRFKEKFIGCEH